MRISVFGLGYVGTVAAACLAREGYEVTAVDVKPEKVDRVNQGEAPIEEPGVDDLVAEGVAAGRLSATTDAAVAIERSRLSFVCVGTPVDAGGEVDLSAVENVATEIGTALTGSDGYHSIVLRSTVPPGTTADVERRIAETADRRLNDEFGVVMNPEFVREGSAVADFQNPPFVVLGGTAERSIADLLEVYEELGVTAEQVFTVEAEAAELVKYASNAFHALKVAFANEVGRVAKEQGVDGRTVMGVFCQDTKLNVSPYYLTPGFSFGGSCLHKDTRAFAELADSALPLVESIHPANREHTERAVDAVRRFDPETVGIAGVSFKPDTDDMRNSPAVELARQLLDDGYDVYTYDPDVDPAALVGSNRAYVEERLPELATLQMDSLAELVAAVDVVVVGNSDVAFESLRETDVPVFDPVGLFEDRESDGVGYESLCW